MGWLFLSRFTERSDRTDFIKWITKRQENKDVIWESLAHCLRGRSLWSVMQVTNKTNNEIKKFIMLYLIEYHNGYWGYKEIDEGMGPDSLTCPPKYLSLADEVNPDSIEGEWRTEVLRFFAQKKENRRKMKNHAFPH